MDRDDPLRRFILQLLVLFRLPLFLFSLFLLADVEHPDPVDALDVAPEVLGVLLQPRAVVDRQQRHPEILVAADPAVRLPPPLAIPRMSLARSDDRRVGEQ